MRKLALLALLALLGSCCRARPCPPRCTPKWDGTCPDVRTDPRACRSAQEAAGCCGGGLPVCR